jgi:transcriptional regulator with XRE-family HTH domain
MRNRNTVELGIVKSLARQRHKVKMTRTSLEDHWEGVYVVDGGPLMGMLIEEAARRNLSVNELAECLGVTVGYLAQLHDGIRKPEDISRAFAWACGVFLGIPAVVVLILAGCLKLVDCVSASGFERWVEDEYANPEDVALRCGALLGQKELRLLPMLVRELAKACAIHEMRRRTE